MNQVWQPIETAPKGRIVLVHYKNRLGNGRTMRGRYYLPETLESDVNEDGWAPEGWYEESEAYEYLMPLDGDPTHWMSLPPEPAQLIMQQIDEDGTLPTDDCECHRCIDEKDLHTMFGQLKLPISASKMILCPVCGNKRCPKASDHRLDCTNSNEPGQPGSPSK